MHFERKGGTLVLLTSAIRRNSIEETPELESLVAPQCSRTSFGFRPLL